MGIKMKTQTLSEKAILFKPKDIALACAHIEEMWNDLTKENTEDNGTLIGLPYPYVVPSVNRKEKFVFEEMYYSDSYFIARGLLQSGKNELAEGMLENLIYMYKRFHIIPNASRFYLTGRSQPPYLTSYIFDIYEADEKSVEWLREKIDTAENEYRNVWTASIQPNIRNVYKGLSRYYDINYLDDLAEAESGWDMTTRYEGECLSYIPVDLNSLLYKYEIDIAKAYEIFGDEDTAEVWRQKASVRANTMTSELWIPSKGFFFDLNYETSEHSEVWSLAGFYTMWAGLATEIQAEKMVYNLKKFLKKDGLTTTASMIETDSREISKQWAYPNGWAPLHWIVVHGLEKYGYHEEAEIVARKWLNANLEYHKFFGVFREAYNVVEPLADPVEGVYPSQTGFGWTNGVFLDLAKKYLDEEEKSQI